MEKVKGLFIASLVLLSCITVFAAEFLFWSATTPGGNTITYEKEGNSYCIVLYCSQKKGKAYAPHHKLKNIRKWYFFKDFIVGEIEEKGEIGYFLFNEKSCFKEVFVDESMFLERVSELKLEPFIWKRYFTTKWGIIVGPGDLGDAMLYLTVKLPLFLALLIATIVGLFKTDFRLSHYFNKVTLSILLIVLIRVALDIYPISF